MTSCKRLKRMLFKVAYRFLIMLVCRFKFKYDIPSVAPISLFILVLSKLCILTCAKLRYCTHGELSWEPLTCCQRFLVLLHSRVFLPRGCCWLHCSFCNASSHQFLTGSNKHLSAVTCLQFRGNFIITSSDDGTVKLWDVETGKVCRLLCCWKHTSRNWWYRLQLLVATLVFFNPGSLTFAQGFMLLSFTMSWAM